MQLHEKAVMGYVLMKIGRDTKLRDDSKRIQGQVQCIQEFPHSHDLIGKTYINTRKCKSDEHLLLWIGFFCSPLLLSLQDKMSGRDLPGGLTDEPQDNV